MSRADFYTLERKKITVYSDFLTSFARNPTTGYLGVKSNEDAVKQSLKNLVLTNVGERFYDSNKGSRVRRSLFSLYDPAELEFTKTQLEHAIQQYEPRANPFNVSIINDLDNNSIRIKIIFQVINILSPPTELNIFVEKVR